MTRYVIPLTPEPQSFSITLGGVEYSLTARWCDAQEGGWLLDIGRAEGAVLVAAIPLVTGVDLLAPYPEHNWGGWLWVQAANDAPPLFDTLGTDTRLIFETEDA